MRYILLSTRQTSDFVEIYVGGSIGEINEIIHWLIASEITAYKTLRAAREILNLHERIVPQMMGNFIVGKPFIFEVHEDDATLIKLKWG